MNILVTGAKGMVGTALCANLKNLRDGKNRTRPGLRIDKIYKYDLPCRAGGLLRQSGLCVPPGGGEPA